jgi:D-proline reductase (dithiol) PrdB|tara:strand:+ start:58 stop:804 length:747 start_codon:yes stop_codon:yes gene_type:complete
VCALSYYLEREGIMTTGISLVRENAQSMQPPRSLWVPFPLGRPLGKPNDKAFQHRVIAAALALLERTAGPVLEDYPEDAPSVRIEESAACPVSFGNTQAQENTWTARFQDELTQMQPWYELGKRKRRGRSLVGVADEPMENIFSKLGELLDKKALPTADLKWFKLAIEDAKVFYIEALTAQPGEYSAQAIEQILWHKTQLGAGLKVFYQRFAATPKLAIMARMVASREAIGGSTGEEIEINDITQKEE